MYVCGKGLPFCESVNYYNNLFLYLPVVTAFVVENHSHIYEIVDSCYCDSQPHDFCYYIWVGSPT